MDCVACAVYQSACKSTYQFAYKSSTQCPHSGCIEFCVCVCASGRRIPGLIFLFAFRRAELSAVSILGKFIFYATGSCLHLLYMLPWLWIVCGAQSFEVTLK